MESEIKEDSIVVWTEETIGIHRHLGKNGWSIDIKVECKVVNTYM